MLLDRLPDARKNIIVPQQRSPETTPATSDHPVANA